VKGEGGPKAALGAAAKQTRGDVTPADRLPLQASLFGGLDYPADLMYPPRAWAGAEWHMRLTASRMAFEREPRHWWLRDLERRRDGAA
jgi:hypothetical protein